VRRVVRLPGRYRAGIPGVLGILGGAHTPSDRLARSAGTAAARSLPARLLRRSDIVGRTVVDRVVLDLLESVGIDQPRLPIAITARPPHQAATGAPSANARATGS
jgi:hypothetical protein